MPSNFTATDDFLTSLNDINTLVSYATNEAKSGNEINRILFLKLGVVSIVTKFQVFIEAILKEYLFYLRTSSKAYGQVSLHLRLNSIKLFSLDKVIHKALENPEIYNLQKLNEIKMIASKTLNFCEDSVSIDGDLAFDTKFPMGKTGLGELTKLFQQVKGEDVFETPPFDINKLNEILGRRHAIIHEDSNPQITEQIVDSYKTYMITVVNYIDDYLGQNK
jgi:hypothetical protein